MQKSMERRKGSRAFLSRATLVPPQTLKGGNMIDHTFYRFLSVCQGSWRNSVYISTGGPGYLLSTDRDGRPIVMPVEQFQQLAGEIIDPAECCGQLTDEGFRALYAQYLLCRMPSAEVDPLCCLSQSGPERD